MLCVMRDIPCPPSPPAQAGSDYADSISQEQCQV